MLLLELQKKPPRQEEVSQFPAAVLRVYKDWVTEETIESHDKKYTAEQSGSKDKKYKNVFKARDRVDMRLGTLT